MDKRERSEIERLVRDVRKTYSQIRSLERQVNKMSRVVEMFGIGMPALHLLGPYSPLFYLVFQIATQVSQSITRMEIDKRERESERTQAHERLALINELKRELEKERIKAYRSVVPT